ncbi:MAG: sigma-70 family RNA polymerase sigma factor [Planctomycetes bacterium]|nr:sigma-70 family RNA polymerase sigma factor [Planctomycetota bacterium]
MSGDDHERTWIDAAQRGDHVAVSKLLARYYPVLRARAEAGMRPALRARFAPEDILQQVYLDVFEHIDRFEDRGPDSFLNWSLTILDHKLVDAWRAAHRRRRDAGRERRAIVSRGTESYMNLLDELHAHSVTPSRIVRREEAVGAMLACLSRLSEDHAEVLRLRFLQGRPLPEVAKRLEKSEGAVVALTGRALRDLATHMERVGEVTRSA